MVHRIVARTRRSDYGPEHFRCLLPGLAFIPVVAGEFYREGEDRPDPELMREAWECLRHELLPAFIHEHPGTRPWVWWKLEAPEQARRLLSGVSPLQEPDAPEFARDLSFGITHCYGARQAESPPVWESQASYLKRHNLLEPEEEAALTFEDFQPEYSMAAKMWPDRVQEFSDDP